MNGTLPKPPDDLSNTATFRQWVVDRLCIMPCVKHDKLLTKLEADAARTAGQRSMLRMALPYVIPAIVAIGGVLAALKYGPAPTAPAPATPRVTTSVPR